MILFPQNNISASNLYFSKRKRSIQNLAREIFFSQFQELFVSLIQCGLTKHMH